MAWEGKEDRNRKQTVRLSAGEDRDKATRKARAEQSATTAEKVMSCGRSEKCTASPEDPIQSKSNPGYRTQADRGSTRQRNVRKGPVFWMTQWRATCCVNWDKACAICL